MEPVLEIDRNGEMVVGRSELFVLFELLGERGKREAPEEMDKGGHDRFEKRASTCCVGQSTAIL